MGKGNPLRRRTGRPDTEASSGVTRQQMVEMWKEQAEVLYQLARLENDAARLRAGPLSEDLERRVEAIEADIQTAIPTDEDPGRDIA